MRFDTNVSKNLSWRFQPEQSRVDAVPGQTATVFFKVRNNSDRVWTATAAYNVSPDQAGSYFTKISCFCFEEQRLGPGESAEVTFTAPTKPGKYVFLCSFAGHWAAGMTGDLIVK